MEFYEIEDLTMLYKVLKTDIFRSS